MSLYGYQRSRSFIDLGPRSLRSFSILFFLETAWPIEAKFYVEPPWDGGTKVWSNGLGHLTKMAAMPIYVKNLKESSYLEPKGWWPWKFLCSIEYSSTTKLVQTMTMGWPWLNLRQGQMWSLMLLYAKKVKQWIFFRNYYIKVGRCSQLNEYMKLYEYQRSRSFIDLGPSHSDSIFLNFFSSITADFNIFSALRWAIQDQWSSVFFRVVVEQYPHPTHQWMTHGESPPALTILTRQSLVSV